LRGLSQRRALGALFLVLAASFAALAVAAARAGVWVIAFAAVVLGFWLLTMAFRGLRPR
jgi:hypothetical protein